MIITVFLYLKRISHLPSQLGIFVFTFTVKRFHIYGALLHLALKVFTFTGPYYIFTFRGATRDTYCFTVLELKNCLKFDMSDARKNCGLQFSDIAHYTQN